MASSRSDIADFSYFLAIARHSSFRRAALELGVSASALSHSLRGLEERLGVRLLNRTNRSVTLTTAGEELRREIEEPFARIAQARETLNRFRDTPAGRIRLNVMQMAATHVLAPVLPEFMKRYPGIEVDIVSTNRMVDVVGAGFDAGIRYGGTVPEDMIAQRLSDDIRWIVVASPAYLAEMGVPQTPQDLAQHRCLGVRLGDDRIYRWEFMGVDGEFDVAVPAPVTLDESQSMLKIAIGGGGLMYGPEPVIAPHIASGALSMVLEGWATSGPGVQIYYPSRRQMPTGLRLLIELIREMKPLA